MKRNCNSCKALNTYFEPKCDLGYNIGILTELYGISVSWKPLEECPKPVTYNELCKIKLNK